MKKLFYLLCVIIVGGFTACKQNDDLILDNNDSFSGKPELGNVIQIIEKRENPYSGQYAKGIRKFTTRRFVAIRCSN